MLRLTLGSEVPLMPYYCLTPETGPTHETTSYALRADAYAALQTAATSGAPFPEGTTVRYVATRDETDDWHQRELSRFDDGTYKRTPWYDRHPAHFVHL